jgi:ribokinase
MGRIGFVASCIMDLTFQVDQFPEPGETVMARDFHTGFGGKGANQAVAAAKSGGSVRVIGAVGDDTYGADTIENFVAHGINADHVFQIEDAGTGLASISVDETGENEIAVAPRANQDLSPSRVDEVPDDWFQLGFISGVNEMPEPLLVKCFRRARRLGDAEVVLNAAPARPLSDELWELVDCLIVNEKETEFYTNVCPSLDDSGKSIETFFERGVKRVIMTLGEDGSVYADPEETVVRPAPSVETVDATGAGDAFVGAYLTARSRGLEPGSALEKANQYAAESVTGEGTQKSFPNKT